MKRVTILLTLATVLTIAGGQPLFSQADIRFAHVDNERLIRALPDTDSAFAQIEKLRTQLIGELEELQVEFNNKLNTYQTESTNWSEMVRSARENELNTMNQNIENFTAMAQQQMQERQAALLRPIYEKVQRAIRSVAQENGFIYVFDVSEGGGGLLYVDEERSTNIFDLVLAKLREDN